MQRLMAGPALRQQAIEAVREHYFAVKTKGGHYAELAGRLEGHAHTSRKLWLEETSSRLERMQELDEMLRREGK